MSKLKYMIKGRIIAAPKGAWLFAAYKRDGMRGVAFEILLTFLVKIGLEKKLRVRKQAFFLFRGSKHLNLLEKFLAAGKNSKQTAFRSPGKQMMKKNILPLEEI